MASILTSPRPIPSSCRIRYQAPQTASSTPAPRQAPRAAARAPAGPSTSGAQEGWRSEPSAIPGSVMPVGQDHVVGVDHGERQHQGSRRAAATGASQGEAEAQARRRRRAAPVAASISRVAPGDRCAGRAAAPAQQQEGEHRQVVDGRGSRRRSPGSASAGMTVESPSGSAVDDHVQVAADDQPEERGVDAEEDLERHGSGFYASAAALGRRGEGGPADRERRQGDARRRPAEQRLVVVEERARCSPAGSSTPELARPAVR